MAASYLRAKPSSQHVEHKTENEREIEKFGVQSKNPVFTGLGAFKNIKFFVVLLEIYC